MSAAFEREHRASASTVPAANFAGLLAEYPRVDDELLGQLRRVGYDPQGGQRTYPVTVWRDALHLLRLARFGHLRPEQGYRDLGRLFFLAIARTPVGAALVISVGDDIFRLLASVPKAIAIARSDLDATGSPESDRSWRVHCLDDYPLPDFLAGMIEQAVGRIHPTVSIEVQAVSARVYDLLIRW